MIPGASKTAILACLNALLNKHTKTYCWPTLETIKQNLAKYHSINIEIRTISKHLQELRDFGYLKSFTRYGRKSDGTFFNKPSNRQLTRKAFTKLTSLGVRVKRFLWDWINKRILPARPQDQQIESPQYDLDQRSGFGRIEFPFLDKIAQPVTS